MTVVRCPGLLQYLIMWIVTLFCGPTIMLLAFLGKRRAAYRPIELWSRCLHLVSGVRYRISGLENVPADGPYVIISNHASHLDGPTLIVALPHPIYFIIKKELARIPIWGPATLRAGFVAVDRADSERARQQMAAAVKAIRSGRCVLVFAEGTRSRTDALLPFKKGGFHLALDAQVPILPIAVSGSRTLWPKGTFAPRPGTMDIVVGEPITTTGLGKKALPDLLERTRKTIESMRQPLVSAADR